MTKYVHCFLRAPIPMIIMVNDVQLTITNIEKIGLQFVPQFIITENVDPPFTAAKAQSQGANHLTYMGYQTVEQFLAVAGVQQPVTFAVHDAPPAYTPTITNDLAFLAALEQAVSQYGEAMPVELNTLLSSFIAAEKDRHNIGHT